MVKWIKIEKGHYSTTYNGYAFEAVRDLRSWIIYRNGVEVVTGLTLLMVRNFFKWKYYAEIRGDAQHTDRSEP